MCQYGERVVDRLREWHVSLIQEADRCRTMVETEVAKLKEKMESKAAEQCRIIVETEVAKAVVKMEIENTALRKEIEIGKIHYQEMKNNYRTIILCTWILIVAYLFMAGSTSKGAFEVGRGRMLLP
jgi:predicted phage tail protein